MSLSRQIAMNTLTQMIGRGGVILFSFLTTARLTRQLGQAGYGAFGVINTATLLFFAFADWGTNLMAVRESAQGSLPLKKVLGNCLLLRTLMSLGVIVFYLLFILLNPSFAEFRSAALLSGLIIFFLSFKTSAQIIFHTQLKLYLNALVELVAGALFFLFVLLVGELTLIITIKLLVLAALLTALLALVMVVKMTGVDFSLEVGFLKRLIKESLPMGALLAVFSISNRLGVFLLQSIKGEEAVGLYILAHKFHDNLILGAAYLMSAFYPVLSSLSTQEKKGEEIRHLVQKAFDLLIIMAIIMMIVVFFLAPLIINLLGGQEFLAAAKVLRILIWATGIGYLNHLTGYTLVALGQQKAFLKFGLVALVSNFIFNLILIPTYSFLGVSVVTVLTEGLTFVLTFLYLKRVLAIPLKLTTFPVTLKKLIINRKKFF